MGIMLFLNVIIRYDLEMHMLHVSPDPRGNKVAVVGAFYKIGHDSDPFLSQVINYFIKLF